MISFPADCGNRRLIASLIAVCLRVDSFPTRQPNHRFRNQSVPACPTLVQGQDGRARRFHLDLSLFSITDLPVFHVLLRQVKETFHPPFLLRSILCLRALLDGLGPSAKLCEMISSILHGITLDYFFLIGNISF